MTYSRPVECEKPLAEHCLIWLDGVDLLYWPTPYVDGVSPATSLLPRQDVGSSVVIDDFEFTTGSAYLVYKNAKAILPFNTEKSTTGPFYTSLTVGYPEKSLSTFYSCNPSGFWPFKSIDYEDFNQPPRWRVVSEQRPCHVWSIPGDSMQQETFPVADIATDYSIYSNQPLVLLPGPLTFIDPAWRSCAMGDAGIGLYDPPRPLRPVNALTPEPTSAVPALAQESAQPASVVASAGPKPTGITVHLPNGDTIVDYPPAGASFSVPVQSSGPASSTGVVVANRPLPFDPNKTASPQQGGSGGSSGGEPANPVQAGSQPKPGSDTQDQPSSPVQAGPVSNNNQNGDQPNKPNEVNHNSPVPGSNNHQDENQPNKPNEPDQNSPVPVSNNPQHENPSNKPNGADQNSPVPVNTNPQNENQPSKPNEGTQDSAEPVPVVAGSQSNGNDSPPNLNAASPGTSPGTTKQPQQPPAPIKVGGHEIQAAPQAGVVVDGATLASASPSTTVNGVQLALHSSGIVVGGNTLSVPQLGPGNLPTPVSFNGHSVQVNQGPSGDKQLVVDGKPVAVGVSQAQVGENVVSVLNNGQLSVLPTTLPYVPLPTDKSNQASGTQSQALTPYRLPNGDIKVADAVITPGSPPTMVSGTPVSVLPDGQAVVVGQKTIQPIPTTPPAVGWAPLGIIVNGETLTPVAGGGVAFEGTTILQPGQSLTLHDGKVASITNGNVAIGTQTLPIPSVWSPPMPQPTPLTVHGQTFTPLAHGSLAVDGTTLTSGESYTMTNGQVATLQSDALVVGSSTIPLPSPEATSHSIDYQSKGLVVVDSSLTFTPVGSTGVAIAGSTISTAGQTIKLPSGSVATLESDGALVMDAQTMPLSPSASHGVGWWVANGMGGDAFTTLSDGKVAIDGMTLSPGGSAVTLSDGEILSLAASTSGMSDGSNSMAASATATVVQTGGSLTLVPSETPTPTSSGSSDGGAPAAFTGSSERGAAVPVRSPQLVLSLLCVFAAWCAVSIAW